MALPYDPLNPIRFTDPVYTRKPVEQVQPGPAPIVDVISQPAPPVTIITAPAQQQGFQLTSTQLIIGIVILLLVLKK